MRVFKIQIFRFLINRLTPGTRINETTLGGYKCAHLNAHIQIACYHAQSSAPAAIKHKHMTA